MEEPPLYYQSKKKKKPIEEMFDIVRSSHIATGHGDRDRMLNEVKKKYANISVQTIELFKSLCTQCQKKRVRPKTTGVVVRPILTKDFACRGQVDLVDMQSMCYNGYRWIMVYQDHLTKFCVLRAVKSKRSVEIGSQLLDIFLLFGAPAILQSNNETEFTANVICELKEFWPAIRMVHGKPRYPQSQGSVERANGDIMDMLVAWLTDNESQDWVAGIKFVQFQKNSSHHAGIRRSPYSALFGNEARVGLTSSLPREILDNLESEQDLARHDLASAESPVPSADTGLTSVEPTPLASSLDEPVPTAFSSDEPAPTASSSAEPARTAISSAETGPSSTDTTSNSSESAPLRQQLTTI